MYQQTCLLHACMSSDVSEKLLSLSKSADEAQMSRYAAKLDSEGAAMYDAAKALKEAMIDLGLACDGGKDSLSMAASVAGEVQALLGLKWSSPLHKCIALGRSLTLLGGDCFHQQSP